MTGGVQDGWGESRVMVAMWITNGGNVMGQNRGEIGEQSWTMGVERHVINNK